MIPHSKPTLGREEAEAAARVVASGHPAAGPETEAFERECAATAGVRHGTAVSTGSAALHVALEALGVGHGDGVVVPSYACSALLNVVRYIGAEPLVADVDPATRNLSVETVRAALRPGAKAAIVPHLLGLPAPVRAIRALGLLVVEDCAMAFGCDGPEGRLGSSGEVAVCSFYATKLMTTGQGGMVLTDDADLHARARDLVEYDERDDYRVRYNYRMTDLAAAIGRVQLRALPGFIARRRAVAARYGALLAGSALGLPGDPGGHLFFRYGLLAEGRMEGMVARLGHRGVAAKRPIFRPIHAYLGMADRSFPGAALLHERLVSIPIYPSLTDAEVEQVAEAVRRSV